jgi:hypothetical protein
MVINLFFIIVGGEGRDRDRERVGWCMVWGVAECSIQWGTCLFQQMPTKWQVKKG